MEDQGDDVTIFINIIPKRTTDFSEMTYFEFRQLDIYDLCMLMCR